MAMTVAFWALNTVFVVQAQEASLRFTIQLRQNLESFLRGFIVIFSTAGALVVITV